MAIIPKPTNLGTLQDWRRDVQRSIEMTGARILEAASITQGVLRVIHKGNILIDDGGHLILGPKAILRLGKGMIDGAALKEQFEPVVIDLQKDTQNYASSSSWKTVRSTQLSAPTWATRGLVMVTATLSANQTGELVFLTKGAMRIVINGKSKAEMNMITYSYYAENTINSGANGNLTSTCIVPIGATENTVNIDLQALITAGNGPIRDINTTIGGLIIWTRQS